jgi:hypothetical protein
VPRANTLGLCDISDTTEEPMRAVRAALLSSLVLVFTVTGAALADQPVMDRFITVSDQVLGPCPDGSVINAHLTFDIRRWIFPDRQQFVIHIDHSYTKSTTGESFRSFGDYLSVVYLDPNSETGSSGASESGSLAKNFVVGEGLLSNQSGRVIYDADGDIVARVGVDDLQGFDLCAWEPI